MEEMHQLGYNTKQLNKYGETRLKEYCCANKSLINGCGPINKNN